MACGNIRFKPMRKKERTYQERIRYEAETRLIRLVKLGCQVRKFKNSAGEWYVATPTSFSKHWVRLDRAIAIRDNGWEMLDSEDTN